MIEQNINIFEQLSIPRALAKFIIPSVISQLATLILNLTDAFFVGRTGDTFQISAMTITFPLIKFMTCTAMIFGTGGNANVASLLATKNSDKARKTSCFAFYTALAVIAVISVILYIYQKTFVMFLGADQYSLPYCQGYLLWVFHIPCIAMVGSQVLAQLFVAEGETKIASIGITGAGIINIILDPLFVLGLKQGIVGAGIATCIANYSSFCFFLAVYMRKKGQSVICLHPRCYAVKNGIALHTLAVGIPAGLSIFLMNCSDFVRNYLLGVYGGQAELAAWGTVQKLSSAFMQICIGVVQGMRPLVSYNFAAKAWQRTRAIIRGAFIILISYAFICVRLVMLVPQTLVCIFLPVASVASLAEMYFRIWIPCFFGVCIVEGMNCILQVTGQWKISLIAVVFNRIVIYIPCMLILSYFFKIPGVLFSQTVSETIIAAVLFFVYLKVMKQSEIKECKND